LTIFIKNLSFYAILGILEEEREKPQKIVIDAKITYYYTGAYFINYAEVSNLIKSTMVESKFELIEEALEKLLIKIKKNFPKIDKIRLQISKPDILQDCQVGAKIKKNFKKN